MIVLSLDQALKVSGWCIWENNKPIKYGVFQTKNTDPIDRRLGQFWKELNNLYAENEFDYLVFEDCQQQQNAQTYHKLSMVKASVLLWCYFNEINYEFFSPSSWRSINGGGYGRKREEQKEKAIQNVKDLYGIDVPSDIADAIEIGRAYINNKRKTKNAFDK